MSNEYHILCKKLLVQFSFQQMPKRMLRIDPDLLLEMTFSPKLFIIDDIDSKVEAMV